MSKDLIEKIYDYSLEEIMGDRFGRYSKAIIQDRALPDVRDGLKPVQRRILYAMFIDHNTYDKPTKKCAKAVGNIMGNYHPHGDSSIYDAMVRMSQDWKMREKFIDMQGNNGSIDGDGAAAMRYTEARLSKIANVMLKDIQKECVEMTYTFDDTDFEPTVLPANFPNLLVNGSTGISAGYATNIPPHNLGEVIDATIKRIDNPNCRLETIMDIIKGPDFPTGAIIEGKNGIQSAYENGRGKIVIKSKYTIEHIKGKDFIIITEIPYDVLKQGLIKKIQDIKSDKKIDGIVEVLDQTDRNNAIKITIELKKDANPDLIVNYLLKNTEMQINYNFNMIAIVNRRPKCVGIMEILDAYIAHQREVITKRSIFDLKHARERLHIVEGFIKMVSILDEVIHTIRKSNNKPDAINNLVKEYGFSVDQATAIVTLQLYRLTNTDVVALQEEHDTLLKIIEGLELILNNEDALKNRMKLELREVKKEYDNPRRTEVRDEISEIRIDMTEMIPKENVVVIVTNEGYVKRVSMKSYTASCNEEETTLKPGDYVTGKYNLTTLDKIMLFTNLGNYLFVPVHAIGEAKYKELGKHISNVVMINANERIIGSMPFTNSNELLTFVTKNGMIKRSIMNEFEVSRYSKPMTCMKLKDDDELISVTKDYGKTLLVTKNGYYLNYLSEEIPAVGIKASGVKGISLKDDQVISGLSYDNSTDYVAIITNNKSAKRIKIAELDIHSRAKRGSTLIKKVKTNVYLVLNAFLVKAHDILGIKMASEINELKISEIPIMDLASTGSNISKFSIDNTFIKANLIDNNNPLKKEKIDEIKKEENIINEPVELTIDDFIEDFKL